MEVLSTSALCMRYGAVHALHDVTLALEGPQLVGVLGPNGAGKTTLLNILTGLVTPTSGEVRVLGEEATPARYPRRRIGAVFQKEAAPDGITVRDYAALFAAIYKVRDGRERIIARAQLEDRAMVPVERLSGGEAQRLYIAAASIHAPELLFLDEPTAHLDPAMKRDVGAFIQGLGQRSTVILTTHDLHEADAVCDYVVFLVGGTVKAAGAIASLKARVPAEARRTGGLDDAFFHFCGSRVDASGALLEEDV